MLKITVRLHGQNIQTLELSDPATTYWAGRGENCQISLKNASGISRQHFKIHLKEGLWNVEVVSPYGNLQVGDQTFREMVLQEGASFSLTPYEFTIENQNTMQEDANLSLAVGDPISSEQSPRAAQRTDFEHTVTMALEKNKQFVLNYKNAGTKAENIFILTNKTYLVGRDQGCEIVLDDPKVSRRQFKLISKNYSYYIVDNQGVNGTYLNGQKITNTEPVELKSNDRITVLNHHFSFEIRDPNFQTKLDNVPQLALVDPLSAANPMGVPSSMPYGLNPNYSINDALGGLNAPTAPPAPLVKTLNFWGLKIPLTKQNKFRLALVGVLFIALVVSLSDDSTDFDNELQVQDRPSDPISKLSPEEQKQVKVQYELAKDLYTKGNYQLAKEELSKIHAKIPSYLDSIELARFIEVGIQSTKEREHQERLKREAAEAEEKIQNIVAFCRQQLKPTTSVDSFDECLAPAIQLNPEHELLVKAREEVLRMEEERKARAAEQFLREAQIKELEKQYKLAYEIGKKNPLKGIKAFEDFLQLSMPDPKKLQAKAKRDIKRLQRQIESNVNKAIASVKKLVEEGNHKEAIMSLERALEVSPEDDSLANEIEKITEDLRKKMQILYQEAILEENIGNVETAKDRWKKILNQDIPNGEYYSKAFSKLKKYGGP